jgi:hypothetical protein
LSSLGINPETPKLLWHYSVETPLLAVLLAVKYTKDFVAV